MGEALWQTRLRWRLRGAMLWPAFIVAIVAEALLLELLPVSGDGGPGLFAAVLLAGFLNLGLVAVAAPLAGRWVRRRRPAMPAVIATDRAGTALLDAPHEEHVAQERDAVLERQVLGYGVRRVGARGLGCHQACCFPSWSGARAGSPRSGPEPRTRGRDRRTARGRLSLQAQQGS